MMNQLFGLQTLKNIGNWNISMPWLTWRPGWHFGTRKNFQTFGQHIIRRKLSKSKARINAHHYYFSVAAIAICYRIAHITQWRKNWFWEANNSWAEAFVWFLKWFAFWFFVLAESLKVYDSIHPFSIVNVDRVITVVPTHMSHKVSPFG